MVVNHGCYLTPHTPCRDGKCVSCKNTKTQLAPNFTASKGKRKRPPPLYLLDAGTQCSDSAGPSLSPFTRSASNTYPLVPVARTSSYDRRCSSCTTTSQGSSARDIKETQRLVVDQLKGNIFINQYLLIKDLGRGAHGTVKLVYNTQDDMLYAMKVIRKKKLRCDSYLSTAYQSSFSFGNSNSASAVRPVGPATSPVSCTRLSLMSPSTSSMMLPPSCPVSPTSIPCLSPALSPTQGPASGGSSVVGNSKGSPVPSRLGSMTMTTHAEYSNEIAVMKELDHPHVVKLYEVIANPQQGKLLMIMEYVEGGCILLGNSPVHKNPIPEDIALKYFRDVVKGLEYLHYNLVVHGDIKPDNLLLTNMAKVKISDFGSARFCEKHDTMLVTAGTPAFMAPEMCTGKSFHGFAADIWALGICLYMFVYGTPPFTGSTTYQTYNNIQNRELVFPSLSKISVPLQHLLGRLLDKDPSTRATLKEIMSHPWVTQGGLLPPLLSSEDRALQRVHEAMRHRAVVGDGIRHEAVMLSCVELHELIPDAEERCYQDGDCLIKQGEVAEGLFFITDGNCEVCRTTARKADMDADFADALSNGGDEEQSNTSDECSSDNWTEEVEQFLRCASEPGLEHQSKASSGLSAEDLSSPPCTDTPENSKASQASFRDSPHVEERSSRSYTAGIISMQESRGTPSSGSMCTNSRPSSCQPSSAVGQLKHSFTEPPGSMAQCMLSHSGMRRCSMPDLTAHTGHMKCQSVDGGASSMAKFRRAMSRTESMHKRMAQMVLRAKQHASKEKRRGDRLLVSMRGPGCVLGEICVDGKPKPSQTAVRARGPVKALLLRHDKLWNYSNQPLVHAALVRSRNALLVQETMERFVECEKEVVQADMIRNQVAMDWMLSSEPSNL